MSNLPVRREDGTAARTKGLYRDSEEGKIGGVCAGIARWTGVPAVFWRLGFAAVFFGWGIGLFLYVLMWFIMNDKPDPKPEKPVLGPADLNADDREIWEAVKDDMKSLDLRNDQ